MLTSKQRAFLIGIASNLDPVVQIGKAGVSPETVESCEEAFNTRELVKINVLKSSPEEPSEAAEKLAARTRSENVRVIGRKVILYKPFHDKPEIQLPKASKPARRADI